MAAKVKISGSVAAGFPSPAEQYQEPPLDLNELLVKRPAATFFVRVQGDSMTGAGIQDGDLLVVDRSLRPADGDIIIASVDGDFTVKTLRLGNGERGTGNGERGTGNGMRRNGERGSAFAEATEDKTGNGGEVRLVAANPKYPDIVLKPGQELDYFGKVTACIHQFKKGKRNG